MIHTNDLQVFSRDGQLYTDSREVARMIGKDHAHLMRDIKVYVEVMGKNPKLDSSNFFVPSTYKQPGNGKENPCYLITKKGCEFVANKLTGKKGITFTAIYVNAFHDMEDKLEEKQPPKMTAMEMLRLQGKAMTELDDRVSTVEDKLENQMTIDHGKQRTIQNLVSSRIYKRIEENVKIGCESNIQKCRPLYFQSLYHDLKNRFGVASYRDIKVSQYDDAVKYIESWIEPANLRDKGAAGK